MVPTNNTEPVEQVIFQEKTNILDTNKWPEELFEGNLKNWV